MLISAALWFVQSAVNTGQPVEQVGVKLALCLFVFHPHLLLLPPFIYFVFPHFIFHPCVCCRLFPSPRTQQGFTDGR